MYDTASVHNLYITQCILLLFLFIFIFATIAGKERNLSHAAERNVQNNVHYHTLYLYNTKATPGRIFYLILFFCCLRLDICAVHCSVNKKGILTPRWRRLKNLVALFLFPIFYFYNRINLSSNPTGINGLFFGLWATYYFVNAIVQLWVRDQIPTLIHYKPT